MRAILTGFGQGLGLGAALLMGGAVVGVLVLAHEPNQRDGFTPSHSNHVHVAYT